MSNKKKALTMGLGFAILTLIPIIGFLGMNLATIGATALFIEYVEPTLNTAVKGR